MKYTLPLIALLLSPPAAVQAADATDPYLWLEDILGERSIGWVKEQNAKTLKELEAVQVYKPIYERTLSIFDSQDRIPYPIVCRETIYNFWQDKDHPRGILRRTSLASYTTATPSWELVLDIDAMAKADNLPWVYKGFDCLAPEYRRCMIALSRGGSDAAEHREFDVVTKAFVTDGFFLPEAKSGLAWKDENTLWVGTHWGDGSLTTSGYPRIVKEWKRGARLADARTIFETVPSDMGAWPVSINTPEGRYTIVDRRKTFFSGDTYLGVGDRLIRLDLPSDSDLKTIFRRHVLFSLRSDWKVGGTTYPAGSLLAGNVDDLLRGVTSFTVLFEPSARVALGRVATTRCRIVYTTLDNVKSRMYRVAFAEGTWTRDEVALPGLGAARIAAASDDADLFFYTYEDLLAPGTLVMATGGHTEKVKSLPAFFDATGIEVVQHEATSKDGTRIPYFLVTPKGYKPDGTAPTLLHGYGGFENPLTPSYNPTAGASWVERGGVYVLANIRGGGEFGPTWHRAAMRENHMHNFEDFSAVASDLIARQVTSPRHLGMMGGSQGGLLVGGTFTLYPELFSAVVCQVPLLDMRRYNKLLAGASWMEEYGNPDKPEDWAYIQTWSPYHLVRKGVKYPRVFFWTTTRDDRVHPGHARKMAAKMTDMGHPVYYYENIEGGHGSGSTNAQRAQINALQYAYLWKMLGD
jgi:prolyl oligopeptidase